MRRLEIRITGVQASLRAATTQISDMPGLTPDAKRVLIGTLLAVGQMIFDKSDKTASPLKVIEGEGDGGPAGRPDLRVVS